MATPDDQAYVPQGHGDPGVAYPHAGAQPPARTQPPGAQPPHGAYPPGAEPPPGGRSLRDPTAVMGRRIAAWFLDALLFGALIFVFSPVGPAGTYAEVPDRMNGGDACEIIQEAEDVRSCAYFGDRAYYVEDAIAFLGLGAALAWFVLILVVWQGLVGVTPGKLLFGLRVVDEAGQPPGLGRAFGRSILWVVDGAPWIVPLVGPITGLTSSGHRRVGDMAAKTLVVARRDAGSPPQVPGFVPQVF